MKDKLITVPLVTGFAENAKLSEIVHTLSLEGYHVVQESDWENYKLWKSELSNQKPSNFTVKFIAFQFLEPEDLADPARCVIRTYLDNGNPDEVSTLDYVLVGMQLNPNYMTTDRLFMLLEDHFKEHKVTDYMDKLDEFVVGFVKHLMKLKEE